MSNKVKVNNTLNEIKYLFDSTNYSLRTNDALGIKNNIYPWNNHDFNYSEIVKQQYNPTTLGINDQGCITQVFKNIIKIQKYPEP